MSADTTTEGTTSDLRIEHADSVTTMTIDRDAKRNSLSARLVDDLLAGIEEATTKGSALLVLRGAGRCFSAGFDFTGYDQQSEGDLLLRFVRIELLLQAVAHAPMSTLALAHGKIFGAGADLFAACTHRICTPTTTFRMPGAKFGLLLGTRRLAAKTNPDWANAVLEGSKTFDAVDALHARFATEIVSDDQWDNRIEELTTQATGLDRITASGMRERLTDDTRDTDLAALVRSAARPGLIDRIRHFRGA